MRQGTIRIVFGLTLLVMSVSMFALGPEENDGYGVFAVMALAPVIVAVSVAGVFLTANGFRARSKPQPPDAWGFDPALDGTDAEDLPPRN